MSENRVCPQCGAERTDDALSGLCPKCLARYSFLELEGETQAARPAEGPGATIRIHPESDFEVERTGLMIGRYKLLERIGEGGFGLVYMAEQVEPVQRKVALKVIKAGMDTKAVVARFEAERQALALMDHPNIARVFDAGTTQAGRPYFVMELVRGIPITELCDNKKLDTTDRLALFMTVCHAVQHAHQKGIIHRDLKPSNILVTLHDGNPVPKIIDFGVAKALGQRLTEKTLFTGFTQMIGTPAYMSPEQAEMSGLDVDTRSDIYSLGVLLYELLTGETPFDRETLAKAALDEIRRMIRETDPPKPSTRLQTLGKTLTTVAASRQTDAPKLIHLVRGDLDWIVMKCLDKDRARRYETANGVAMDVKRYLDNEPIVARPPSKLYEFQKTVRRHKFGFIAAGLVMAALMIGLAVATLALVRERQARERAVTAEQHATKEATRSEEVAQFMKEMLSAAGPSVAQGQDATLLKEVLEQTAERVEKELSDQPELQGDLYYTLGSTYQDIADHKSTVDMLQKAVRAYRDSTEGPSAKLALALGRLGFSQSFLENVAEGKANAQLGLEMARQLADQETLATCLYYRARASAHWGMGSAEAEPFLRKSLAIYRGLGDHLIGEARCMRALASDLKDPESDPMARQAWKIFQQQLGPDHPLTVYAEWGLAQILLYQGHAEDAEPFIRHTLTMYENIHSKDHPLYSIVKRKLAVSLALQGNWNEAYEARTGIRTNGISPEFLDRFVCRDVVDILVCAGREQEATSIVEGMRSRLHKLQSENGPHDDQTLSLALTLVDMYAGVGQEENAERLLEELATNYMAALDEGMSVNPERLNELAWELVSNADPRLRAPKFALELATRAVDAEAIDGDYWNTLGVAHYRAGNYAEAVQALEKAAGFQAKGHQFDGFFMAMAQWQLGHKQAARRWYTESVEWTKRNRPQDKELIRFRAEAAVLLGLENTNASD